jgi:hypothetical protein
MTGRIPHGAASRAVIAAVDLDSTLIYSMAAIGHGRVTSDLVCVEMRRGIPSAFMTGRAAALMAELAERTMLVPATTRSRMQLARVRLPQAVPQYAVAANGGHLLVDGVSDGDWHGRVRAMLAAGSTPLAEAYARLLIHDTGAWIRAVRLVEDLYCYAVVDPTALPPALVTDLAGWASGRGWRLVLDGRKLYLVPVALTKAAAVIEVARRVGNAHIVAAGDSMLDAELLEQADAAIFPAHSKLANNGWQRPHVASTAAHGVAAGEEICAWLIHQADRIRQLI